MLVATSTPTNAGGDSSAPMPRRNRAFLARAFISFSRKRKAEEAPVDIADDIPLKKSSSSVKRSASWRQKNTKKELPVEEAAGPAVRIAVRVRPFNKREKDLNSACCVLMPGEGKVVVKQADGAEREFKFDHAYWSHDGFEASPIDGRLSDSGKGTFPYTDQDILFEDLGRPLLSKCRLGFNACVFAYGQTGAGKSYSMTGSPGNPGLIPMVCRDIFESTAEDDNLISLELNCSLLEIYSEVMRDLLRTREDDKKEKDGKAPEIKLREPKSGEVRVDGLKYVPVYSYEDIERQLEFGFANRTIAATAMNATSSRAHTVFTLKIKRTKRTESGEAVVESELHLVDLAGSERQSKTGVGQRTGDYQKDQELARRAKEGVAINQSLSALGNVISALVEQSNAESETAKKKIHINYRVSKLTHLLRNSLNGQAFTVMVAAISPALDNAQESISTLIFADRMKQIKVVAKANVVLSPEAMRKEIERLKKEVEALRAGAPVIIQHVDSGARQAAAGAAGGGGTTTSTALVVQPTADNATSTALAAADVPSTGQLEAYEHELEVLRGEKEEAERQIDEIAEVLREMAEKHKEELRALDRQRLEATERAVQMQEELLELRARDGATAGGGAEGSEENRLRREEDEAELHRLRAELANARQQKIREEIEAEQARIEQARMLVEQDDSDRNAVEVEVTTFADLGDSIRDEPVDVGDEDEEGEVAEEGEEGEEGAMVEEEDDEVSGEAVRELNRRELELREEMAKLRQRQLEDEEQKEEAQRRMAEYRGQLDEQQRAAAALEVSAKRAEELEARLRELEAEQDRVNDERNLLREHVQREQDEKRRVLEVNMDLETKIYRYNEQLSTLSKPGAQEKNRAEVKKALEDWLNKKPEKVSLQLLEGALKKARLCLHEEQPTLLFKAEAHFAIARRVQKESALMLALGNGSAEDIAEAVVAAVDADVDRSTIAAAELKLKTLRQDEAFQALTSMVSSERIPIYTESSASWELPQISTDQKLLESLAERLLHAKDVGVLDGSEAQAVPCVRLAMALVDRASRSGLTPFKLENVPLQLLEPAVHVLEDPKHQQLVENAYGSARNTFVDGAGRLEKARKVQLQKVLNKKFHEKENRLGKIEELEEMLARATEAGVGPETINDYLADLKKRKTERATRELMDLVRGQPGGKGKNNPTAKTIDAHIERLEAACERAASSYVEQINLDNANRKLNELRKMSAKHHMMETLAKGSRDEIQVAIDKAKEMGVENVSIKRAEQGLIASSLRFADDYPLRVNLKKFEEEFNAIQKHLSIDDRKKYRKRLQFVKEKQTNANKGLGCQFWFLDAAKVMSGKRDGSVLELYSAALAHVLTASSPFL